ncbi:MAG TPA: O-antigen ligase family protein, partial [Patescibacteria group bacterium]|nr:O-antigen ligase family protein [Patescibacteria group bacterium]
FGENHNLVAEFLNIGAFFILVIKEFFTTKRLRRLADIAFLLAALGIILTFSRTGWITLFLQTLVYVYFRLKHYPKEKMATAILVVFLVLIASPLLFKMSALQDKNTSSTENRLLLTEISISALKDKPLFGQGTGTFVSLVENDTRFTAKYGPAVDSHGVLQKIAAENGIFGLLTWLFLLLFLVRFCLLAIKKYYPKVSWVLPFALAAFGGIFFQFFNTSYYKGKVWLPLILFMLAISFSEKKYGKKNKNSSYPS